MSIDTTKFPEHACQHCGEDCKLVETIIDDEHIWNKSRQIYEPNKYTNSFDHTGNKRCAACHEEWTGL